MSASTKIKVKKAKIFIVDDHPILRQGLMQLINQEEDMISIGEAGSAAEATAGIAKEKPDVIIMDISLEGTSGLELTKSILTKQPKTLILVVSMYDESIYVERILKAGAKGYLTKREASNHLVSAIRKLLSGEIYVSEKWKDKLMYKFIGRVSDSQSSFAVSLSDRELEVLQFIGQGYSTREIAEEIFVSTKTVESHYANIKNKLDLKNSNELIQHAVKWCLSEK